jgi:hypothetical protein
MPGVAALLVIAAGLYTRANIGIFPARSGDLGNVG